MFATHPTPQLDPGAPLLGGWVVASAQPAVDGLWRGRAVRPDGRSGILEAGTYDGRSIHAWLDTFVEDIEQWADTGAYLPILAGGRLGHSNVVVRIVELPRGQTVASFAGRSVRMGRVVQVAEALASAIAAAHARGLVHGALSADRVHLLPNGVEIEPGGLRASLLPEVEATRPNDVKAIAELMVVLMQPNEVPAPIEALLHRAMNPSAASRPTAAELVGLLRKLEPTPTPPGLSDRSTPGSVNRTVTPRLGVVDVTLPPAPPPAPELRSLVPTQERVTIPSKHKEKLTRTAEMSVAVVVLLLSALVMWWMLG